MVEFLFTVFKDLLILMFSETGGPFERYYQGSDMVVADVHVYAYVDVYGLERKLVEQCLEKSSKTVLITTQDKPVDLVDILGFKLKHRQEIVRYQLRGFQLFIYC